MEKNIMMLKRYVLPLLIALGLGPIVAYADNHDGETRFQQELEETDMEALRDFINSKRKISLKDKSSNLHISGEVHFEWNHYTERVNGQDVRVFTFREETVENDEVFLIGDTLKIGRNDFDVQFDLFIDWEMDKTYARAHVRYDESAGVDDNGQDQQIDPQGYHGSGSCDNLCLKEAYIGYEIFKCGDQRAYIELGRRGNLYKVFWSELEFSSRLDGIFGKYTGKIGRYADWYISGAGFIIDERADHYAWAAEFGLDNILDTGLDFRYSYIDWVLWGRNRYFVRHPLGFRFRVSQVGLIYHVNPDLLCGNPMQVFGAFLVNHTPSKRTFIDELPPEDPDYLPKEVRIGRQNIGWFAGVQFREIHGEGDWMVKGLVAYCEAQVIPDNDVRNIGTGNFLRDSFTSDGRGNVNWQGYAVKGAYAITDNLVIETGYDHSWSIDNSIVGTHSFTRYMLETTYFF